MGKGEPTTGGLVDSILPHTEITAHEKNQWKNTAWPLRTARDESQINSSRRKPRTSESDDELHSPPGDFVDRQQLPLRSNGALHHNKIAVDGQEGIETEMKQLLDGVVDLRNTEDEDKDVQWAPG